MTTFAGITDILPETGSLIAWAIAGVVTGFLTGCLLRGGYGVLADVGAGLGGAAIGGLLFEPFARGDTGFWRGVIVAFLGACILIAIVRLVASRRRWS